MSEDIKNTIEQLTSEYKIAQDKIDKIAAFRFTIRGWTVTLLGGAIIAVASARILDHLLLILVLMLIALLLLLFGFMEARQNRMQELFEDRAYTIEVEIRHLLRRLRVSPYPRLPVAPRIALLVKEQHTSTARRWLDRNFYTIQFIVAVVSIALLLLVKSKHGNAETTPFLQQIIQQDTVQNKPSETIRGSNSSDSKAKRQKNQETSK